MSGSGNGVTRTGSKSWRLTYSYVPNSSATNRQFRIKQYSYSQSSSLTSSSYPRTKDVTTYDNVTTVATNAQTNTRTTTQIIPRTTVVENTTSITKPLFNPKLTGMMTIDNIFNPPSKLNSPFIDLAAIIQHDINS